MRRTMIALTVVSALLSAALATRYAVVALATGHAGVRMVPGGVVVWFGSSWGVIE